MIELFKRCCATVRGGYGTRCLHSATVQRNVHWYCAQHDPERVKARLDERLAEDSRRRAIASLNHQIDDALRNLGELVCKHAKYKTDTRWDDEWDFVDRIATLRERLAKLEGETT